jgi:hypothetical protein
VYDTIINHAPRWWCSKNELPVRHEESDKRKREAVVFLTAEIQNNNEESVIVYAQQTRAFAMLRASMTTHDDMGLFEETNLAPYTYRHASTSTMNRRGSVDVPVDDDIPPTKIVTCLDIVGSMDDELIEEEILNIRPIRVLIQGYYFQRFSVFSFILHIIYMGLFSAYNLPRFHIDSNATAVSVGRTEEGPTSYWFLPWPVWILSFELYYIFDNVNACCRKRFIRYTSDTQHYRLTRDWHIFDIAFSASAIVWFIVKSQSSDAELYLLATALLLGWTYTIYLGTLFSYVYLISHMFLACLRMVGFFLYFYIFILLGFGFAMHALFYIAQDVAKEFPSEWGSLFYCFNIFVGMADGIFDSDFDASYELVGSNSVWVKLVYIFYVTLATIILINMLIAGMTFLTSKAAVERLYRMWKVGLLRHALQVRVELSSC